jgi:hypothetical protein
MSDDRHLQRDEILRLLHTGDLSWRVSANTDGSPTCVEVAACGPYIAIQDTTHRFPKGSAFVVIEVEWEAVLEEATAGQLDYNQIQDSGARRAGPFRFEIDSAGNVEMHHDRQPGPVVFNEGSWRVFIDGVKSQSEFTVEWIRSGSTYM